MTKKIIALVLFVAMMVAMVPMASATPKWNKEYTKAEVLFDGTPWYAKAVSENPTGEKFIIGEYNTGDGVEVEIEEAAKKTTVTITGKWEELQAYYYDYTGNTAAYGKAVKIPFYVSDADNQPATDRALVNGGTTYYAAYMTDNGGKVYYLNFPLLEGGNSATYNIKLEGANSYPITVKFVDEADKLEADAYAAKMEIVGVAGLHTSNFRAEYTNGKYTAPTYTNPAKYDNGTLAFNIAAMTKEDRETILTTGITEYEGKFDFDSLSGDSKANLEEALADELKKLELGNAYVDFGATIYYTYLVVDPKFDEMVVRAKVYDRKGAPYAPGTVVLVKNNGDWRETADWDYATYNEELLGYSEKFVNVDGKATYLVDHDNCIAIRVRGIGAFAMFAARPDFDKDILVYRYTIAEDVELQFVKTTNGEETNVKFDIVFQNVQRTKSTISLLADEYEVVVGEEVMLPYILDNPMAFSTALKTGWVSTNDKVVEVTDAEEGYVKAKAAGKAYVYCTDATGAVKLVVVNAVAKKTEEKVEEVVVPAVTKYVVTASRLNIRTGAGTSNKSLGLIDRNTVVTGVEAAANGWVKVNWNGIEGYCSGKYLAEIN